MKELMEKHLLSANCEEREEMSYMRRFTPEEIREQKDELAEISIDINDVQTEKKDAMKGYTETLKPMTENKKNLLKNIKQKSEMVTEECFKFFDEVSGEIGWYNPEGVLIDSRKAYPGEMQLTIPLHKTGTNN